jgi:signal transduction histidine kinase
VSRIAALWQRLPAPVIDVLAVLLAALDAVLGAWGDKPPPPIEIAGIVLACGALLLRRRFPLIVFLLTIPATLSEGLLAAPMIALFTLSRRTRNRWLLFGCAALFAVASALPWPVAGAVKVDQVGILVYFVYQLATAATPVILGQLVEARGDLARQLVEIRRSKEHEQSLYAESLLVRERAQLAREMHDVVSHQVSLIAVQAAALRVTATTEEGREGAETIRELSVTTLDELRTMVALLRMAGSSSPGLTPQPTMADIQSLITNSGMEVTLTGTLSPEVPAPVQRAIYRTVQEALTNARKHAPGAPVTVVLRQGGDAVGAEITNGPAVHRPLGLPGSRVGLVGLRERSELLGGDFSAEPGPDGGFAVQVSFPVH